MAKKEKDPNKPLYIQVDQPLRGDLEELAKREGTSAGALAKRLIKLYVREETYKKAQELLNIEDRVGTAVLLELLPEFEFIREELMNLREEIQKLKEGQRVSPQQPPHKPAAPREEEEGEITLYEEEDREEKEEKKEEPKLRFPTFVGIDYEIRGDRVYYDDGSVWSIKLGAWLHRGRKVMEMKRKKDRELGR